MKVVFTLIILSILQCVFSKEAVAEQYSFNGMVKLSNCSGALIKFKNQNIYSKALVLTNGHCIQLSTLLNERTQTTETTQQDKYLKNGEFISNRLVERSMQVFNKEMVLIPILTSKLTYATMTGTDLALYELKETYFELNQKGVFPLLLNNQEPILGTNISISSGYLEKIYQCKIEYKVPFLKESQWLWKNSYRYSQYDCQLVGGTSGSPLIDIANRTVVGIHNTFNTHGELCSIKNPCEIGLNGKAMALFNRGYGQNTHQLYLCLNAELKFDLNLETCPLTKTKNATLGPLRSRFISP